MLTKKPTIICLMGPTAAGKTDLAVEIVQQLPCEIVSVDSAMVYREMDIGTAKPSADILQIAPHRLLDIMDPAQAYSAGHFCEDVSREIQDILQSNRIPLLVGGTMLYFHALQKGLAALPQANAEIRDAILQHAQDQGSEALHQRLQQIDPVAAARIHPNDPQRLQRALEVFEITGKTLTELQTAEPSPNTAYNFINLALIPQDRQLLHQNITLRFEQMLKQGFMAEVEQLFQRGDLSADLPAIRSVGYRQAWDYLAGNLSYAEMTERSIIATRQLAKRQLTWLRSWEHLHPFASEDTQRLTKIIELLKGLL